MFTVFKGELSVWIGDLCRWLVTLGRALGRAGGALHGCARPQLVRFAGCPGPRGPGPGGALRVQPAGLRVQTPELPRGVREERQPRDHVSRLLSAQH